MVVAIGDFVDIILLQQEELAHAVVTGQGEGHGVFLAFFQRNAGVVDRLGVPGVVVVVGVRQGQGILGNGLSAVFAALLHAGDPEDIADDRRDFVAFSDIAELHARIQVAVRSLECCGISMSLISEYVFTGNRVLIAIIQVCALAEEEFANAVCTG